MKVTKSYLKQIIKEEISRISEADVLDLSKYRKDKEASEPKDTDVTTAEPETATDKGDQYVNPNKMHDARHKKALIQGMAELGKIVGELNKPYYDQDLKVREAGTGIQTPSVNDTIEAILPILAKYNKLGKDPHGRELSVNFARIDSELLNDCKTAFGNAAGEVLNFLTPKGIRKVRVNAISAIFDWLIELLKKNHTYILAQIAKRFPEQLTQFDKQMTAFKRSMDRQQRAADKRQRDI